MRLKKLPLAIATLATAVLGVVAVAAPANAVNNLTITATVTGQTVANSPSPQIGISVASFTPLGNGFNQVFVSFGTSQGLPQWILSSTCVATPNAANCGISNFTLGGTAVTPTSFTPFASNKILVINLPSTVTTAGGIAFTIGSGVFTTGAAGNVYASIMPMYNQSGSDSGVSSAITVSTAAVNQTVTFDANGGSGSISAQTASQQTALTSNNGSITRTGYNFTGWNTAANGSGTAYADGAQYSFGSSTTLYAQWTAAGGGSSNASNATLTLNLAVGQAVAGAPVDINVTGMQAGAAWDTTVRSTPVSIGTGTIASGGALSQTLNLPSNLGAGWHTITFTSTDASGNAFTSVAYFEVSASGTLVSTSTTKPAGLAETGADVLVPFGAAATLLLVGAAITMIRRRKAA